MVEERNITLLLTFSIANHCIPKRFEFPILPHLLPLLCIRCLEQKHIKPIMSKECRTIRIRKEKKVGRSSPDEQRDDSKLLLQVAADLKPPTLKKKHPEDPKTMKKMKVFSPKNMGHHPKKNEGCVFP